MAQFSANPSSKHMNAAKHTLRYLNTTQSVSIIYDGGSNKGLIAFTDSDWMSDKIKHRSQTSFFFMIAGAIFLWQSQAQKTVALSSTEAKYMALSDCSQQAVWIKSLLNVTISFLSTPPSLPFDICFINMSFLIFSLP